MVHRNFYAQIHTIHNLLICEQSRINIFFRTEFICQKLIWKNIPLTKIATSFIYIHNEYVQLCVHVTCEVFDSLMCDVCLKLLCAIC